MILLLRITFAFLGDNGDMKYPKGKKYGSNSDEKETLLPNQYDLESRFEETVKK